MTCTELEELAGAYVLDAVTPEERQATEVHLAKCPHCIQLIKEMRATVELLPFSVSQVAPPPQLKGRILSAVQATATASSQSTQSLASVRPLQALRMQQRWPTPSVRHRSAAQRLAMPLVAAAAILFLMLSGGLAAWGISLQREVSTLQANTVTTTTYAIKGTTNAPGVTGEATYISGAGVNVTVLTVHGLPSLQGQQVFQGWELLGKQAKSVGLLNVQADGTATINIPGNIKGNDAVAISLENGPTATPDAPKGTVVAEGKVS
ncbi:MAG: hypothetical protein NVSMB38_15360 [Ktedonobacteraceae bacterium]